MLSSLLLALAFFAAYFLSVSLAFHFFKRLPRFGTMAAAFLLHLAALHCLASRVAASELSADVGSATQAGIFSVLAFGLLWYAYMQIFALIEGSLTLGTLVCLYLREGHKASAEELNAARPFSRIINRKIDLMIDLGLARKSGEPGDPRLDNTLKGALAGCALLKVRDFCHWETDP